MAESFFTRVITGKGRGRRLGYPTLNLIIPEQLKAEEGIYAGYVTVAGKSYRAAIHFGPIPTFAEKTPSLEAYLIDASPALPPREVSIELVERLRDIKSFASANLLKTAIAEDVVRVKELLKQ